MKVLIELDIIGDGLEYWDEEDDRQWLTEEIEKIREFKENYRIVAIEYGRFLDEKIHSH